MNKFSTRALVALALAVAVLAVAPAASAHVTARQTSAPAGGYATIELQVPHGCDGEATEVVSVQLRDDISSVSAQAVPGWEVSYDRQPLDEPIELHGEEVGDYVASVTWTAQDQPLEDGQYMTFGISMKMPDLAGETVLLPTVQSCVDGSESAWLDPETDSDAPAPSVELVESDGGHGGDGDAAADEAGTEAVDAESASAPDLEGAAAADPVDDTSDSDGLARVLAVIALVVAAGAAAVGLRRRAG